MGIRLCTPIVLVMLTIQAGLAMAESSPGSEPDWGEPDRTELFPYQSGQSPAANGARLSARIEAGIAPGTRLMVAAGEYALDERFAVTLDGTVDEPIVIEGEGEVVINNAPSQNVFELSGSYVELRGLTFTAGNAAIRLQNSANHIWIDRCHIHHVGDVALRANDGGSEYHHLYITDNEIHHTAGYGEGMYLGGNNGKAIVHSSRIIGNHVYQTLEAHQGDGIELKQGSWGNVIADNLVHDTNYPGILVYGTFGKARNIVERNVCLRSGDNAMQVQGEAIVRNNLCIGAKGFAFQSGDHQDEVRELAVVNNTFINTGRAVRLGDWGGRPDMVFANNACYSSIGDALFTSDPEGVTFTGNVALGAVRGPSAGYAVGTGLGDFVDVSWDGTRRDARPATGSALLGAANRSHVPEDDLDGRTRGGIPTTGAFGSDTQRK